MAFPQWAKEQRPKGTETKEICGKFYMRLKNSKLGAWLSHLISFLLPVLVTIVVPSVILNTVNNRVDRWTRWSIPFLITGLFFVLLGAVVLIACIRRFIVKGRGTLAPWSPAKKLVRDGLYRHVRNPMISGVLLILLGEAIAFRSWWLLIWFLVFFAINHVYFLMFEEPALQKRFGSDYLEYKSKVPRWIPTVRFFSVFMRK
jgi:protein-S-isoprenylcysteine O-methyltransferase Ste14